MLGLSEGETLYVVLAALYLSECGLWLQKRSVALVGGWFTVAPKFASSVLGSRQGGLVPLGVFPPWGRAFRFHVIPVSVSPHTLVAWTAQSFRTEAPAWQGGQSYALDHIQRVQHRDREIFVNGKWFCRFLSLDQATRFVGLMERLLGAPLEHRAPLLRTYWRDQFSMDVRDRYHRFQETTKALQLTSHALWAVLFVIAPLCSLVVGLNGSVVIVGLLMYGLGMVLAW